MSLCFFNGRFIPKKRVLVSGYDLGLVRGYTVFDYLRTYNGRVFELDRHIDRLFTSLKIAEIKIPFSKKKIRDIILKGVSSNGFDETQVRILATPGVSQNSLFPSGSPTFIILFDRFTPFPANFYREGIKVKTFSGDRLLPEIKHAIYFPSLLVLGRARKEGFFEAIYKDRDGFVKEGITSNVFFFKGRRLITPSSGVLKGITRGTIIKLAKDVFPVVEKNVKASELSGFDEMFVTSTNKGVLPVVQADGRRVGDGKVGENTKVMMRLFGEYVAKRCR